MPPTTELPSRWSVAAALATGTALALGLATAVAGLDGDGDPRPHATPGQLFAATAQQDPLPTTRVELPWQHLDVAVAPRPELPELHGERSDVAPPVGGSFVRVDATSPADAVTFAATQRPFATQVEVSVRADGIEYPLDRPGGLRADPNATWTTSTSTHWVAVPGTPSDVELVVDVDGEEQVVGTDGSVERGRAQVLADLPNAEELRSRPAVDCGRFRRTDASGLGLEGHASDVDCSVTQALHLPYVDGLGWARRGHEFLAVFVTLDRSLQAAGAGERWLTTSTTLTGTVDGQDPVAGPVDVNALNAGTLAILDPDRPQMLVFEVPEGASPDLDLEADLTAVPMDPFETRRDQLQLVWTIPGERLS